MQTFLPYPDFQQSAKCLDNKRLGKQRVECLQILRTLEKGQFICSVCKTTWFANDNIHPLTGHKKIFTPWYNHPAVQMWKGHRGLLSCYSYIICEEWIARGFKDSISEKLKIHYATYLFGNLCSSAEHKNTPWLGLEIFHASHRSNLLRKNPKHYSQFGWTESPDLSYYWPSKIKI